LCREVAQLYWRNKTGVIRDPAQSRAKIGQNLVFTLFTSSIFYNSGFMNGDDVNTKVDMKNGNQA
jgi:hypothetical protein